MNTSLFLLAERGLVKRTMKQVCLLYMDSNPFCSLEDAFAKLVSVETPLKIDREYTFIPIHMQDLLDTHEEVM